MKNRPLDFTCRLGLCLAASLLINGCGGPSSPYPVESETARQTLQEVLQSWKDGAAIESWRDHSPEVVVQDIDWETGKALADFEILGDGNPLDAILYAEVMLTIVDDESESREKTVTYQVGTSPVITVFRQ